MSRTTASCSRTSFCISTCLRYLLSLRARWKWCVFSSMSVRQRQGNQLDTNVSMIQWALGRSWGLTLIPWVDWEAEDQEVRITGHGSWESAFKMKAHSTPVLLAEEDSGILQTQKKNEKEIKVFFRDPGISEIWFPPSDSTSAPQSLRWSLARHTGRERDQSFESQSPPRCSAGCSLAPGSTNLLTTLWERPYACHGLLAELKLPEESSLDKVSHSFYTSEVCVQLCSGQGDTVVSKKGKISILKQLQKIDNWYLNKQK